MADITMPQLGETVTEGTITRWAKQVGDRVEEDEVLFEVSTDKVDSEVPSPASGYVAEILVQEGDTVEIGARLAVISDQEPTGDGSGDGAAAPPAEPAPDTGTEEEAEAGAGGGTAVEPEEKAVEAKEAGAPETALTDTGAAPDDGAEPAAEAEPTGAGDRPATPAGDGIVLSPVVRRLISEHNLDPSQIQGTGSGGRITRADVLGVVEGRGRTAPSAPAAPAAPTEPAPPAAPAQAAAPSGEAAAGQRDEVIPFSNIRRRTAEHMVHSLATSAHTLVVAEVDFDNVDRVRNPIREQFKQEEGASLTYLPFIARAVVDAIRDFPHVNASVEGDNLVVHRYVNLGIAVDLNFEGLIVPVVHDADGRRLRALARDIADLAARARTRKLSADEISGGTFTITNAGPYGTFLTAPVINQPQVAILATDAVRMRPVAVEVDDGDWAVAVHPVGNVAIMFDHRAYDGAYAAAFLARVREILETRDWSQEL